MDYEDFENNFEFRLISPHTWLIGTKCPATPFGCDCYLLEGHEKAIMIDAGMSRLNMKTYIELLNLTDKPIIGVINTHSHFDHTGGNWAFQNAFMHPEAEANARKPFSSNEPHCLDYKTIPITEGTAIELGGRTLFMLEIGAHDPSSLAVLDISERILFTGDELETGWINIGSNTPQFDPRQTVESHYLNMLKLKTYYNKFDVICPGHHGAPIAKESLEHFILCDKKILDGSDGDSHIPYKNGNGLSFPAETRVMRHKSAHICYRADRIFKNDAAAEGSKNK